MRLGDLAPDVRRGGRRLVAARPSRLRHRGHARHGDELIEPGFFGGEWGLLRFHDPQNATIDMSFFGLGGFMITDDD